LQRFSGFCNGHLADSATKRNETQRFFADSATKRNETQRFSGFCNDLADSATICNESATIFYGFCNETQRFGGFCNDLADFSGFCNDLADFSGFWRTAIS
jgi:hypothetical protein